MQHKNSTDIHQGAYVQANDPGAVGPNLLWIDTSISPSTFKKRNTGNSGWDLIGNALANPMTAVGDLIVGGASGLPTRFAPGATGSMLGMVGANPTWVQEVTGTDFKPSGLGAATSPSRYVGATASGSPATGAFVVGDWIIDQTPSIWECTVAGSPGTWKQLSGGGGGGGGGAFAGGSPITTSLAVDTVMTSVNTFYDGPTLSLTPGTWFLVGNVSCFDSTSAAHFSAKLWDGVSTVIDSGQSLLGQASGTTEVTLSGYITLTTGTTIKISVANGTNNSTGRIKAATPQNSSGNNASTLTAIPISAVMLTQNSNLLSETVLTSAQASINLLNISQSYRDLRIEIISRGDTAALTANLLAQFNGDTGANYDFGEGVFGAGTATTQTGNTTSARVGVIAAATAVASVATQTAIRIDGYTDSVFQKQLHATSATKLVNGATPTTVSYHHVGFWRNTAPITSILLTLSAGNFLAGTTVRVYGEPVAAGGTSVGTGTRVRNSATQSATTAVALTVGWDTEDNDSDNQHFTSTAALTGTVTKTAASATLVGSGTLFTTELSVGQVITVPGTATEYGVVIGITDATHLTVATAFVNTAAAQTATRVNSPIIFRQPGFYTLESTIYSAAIASGIVTLQFRLNGTTIIDQKDQTGVNALSAYELVTQRQFQQWDFVEVLWTQNSGGSVLIQTDERTHWSVGARPTVIVAIPYINIQDQKVQNTAGGTFTSGSWVQRDLNTLVSDTAGIISPITGNQFSLPAGTYRCRVTMPACQVDSFKARLQNITDSVTIPLKSTNGYSSSSATQAWSECVITGRFTLSSTKTLQVQGICVTTRATQGLGLQGNLDTEVYTVAEFWKEG